ncbi:hypothetical protein EJB05_15890, partial [Eragrostis curvula]
MCSAVYPSSNLVACRLHLDLLKPDATVIFRNARIDMFKGTMRLAVDKWGRIEVTEPADFIVKEENNMSMVEYELVDVVDEESLASVLNFNPKHGKEMAVNFRENSKPDNEVEFATDADDKEDFSDELLCFKKKNSVSDKKLMSSYHSFQNYFELKG